ncbi:hypothetical protein BS47DRAFT_1357199 [Hydnum rufescens UP504]|uniref:Uncharacterized protein n=1 Tax=Hydnum rufescens UP504 TaxID=1448309 RepID=A0A9P6BB08_9AGAM|nr:hypothetical protein BS47DRAFT_1357199 [Hydnum rufescens UP504]
MDTLEWLRDNLELVKSCLTSAEAVLTVAERFDEDPTFALQVTPPSDPMIDDPKAQNMDIDVDDNTALTPQNIAQLLLNPHHSQSKQPSQFSLHSNIFTSNESNDVTLNFGAMKGLFICDMIHSEYGTLLAPFWYKNHWGSASYQYTLPHPPALEDLSDKYNHHLQDIHAHTISSHHQQAPGGGAFGPQRIQYCYCHKSEGLTVNMVKDWGWVKRWKRQDQHGWIQEDW